MMPQPTKPPPLVLPEESENDTPVTVTTGGTLYLREEMEADVDEPRTLAELAEAWRRLQGVGGYRPEYS